MTRARVDVPHEVVDLASDSDDDGFSRNGLEFLDAPDEMRVTEEDFSNVQGMIDELNVCYSPPFGAADGPIDLTAIPDIDVPPSLPGPFDPEAAAPTAIEDVMPLVSQADCLQMVLGVLPDISVDHVLKFIQEQTADETRTTVECERIISQLLDGGVYPKEEDEAKNKKRKRGDDDDWNDDTSDIPGYEADAEQLLKDEFVTVPVRHISAVLKKQKTLFKAYAVIEAQVRNYIRIANTSYRSLHHARNKRGIELILIEKGSNLPKELRAARKKAEGEQAKRHKAEEAEQTEMDNLKRAKENNEMGECACCFDDVPLNRMVSCNGNTTHLYCRLCPRRQIETQMGQSKCRPKCFAVDDCNGTFNRKELQLVLSERTFERLEHMQQQQDLAAAGLDFLSECPFCDFKMECLPVEIDKEFRCQNKKCGKTSCRLCDKITHIPLTCEEAAKDGQITLRHIVEEAMSAALIRQCNKCKHPFVKDYGCNKMTCSHCSNVQCYVCSKNVTGYQHFGETSRGRCPLHENVEDRHEQEVKKAADEAMEKVRADHPDLSDADLMIKVSDRVKEAENARKNIAQVRADAFPFQMVNDNLERRAAQPDQFLGNPFNMIAQPGEPAPQFVEFPFAIEPPPPPPPPPPYRDNLGAGHPQPNQRPELGDFFNIVPNHYFGRNQGPAPAPAPAPAPRAVVVPPPQPPAPNAQAPALNIAQAVDEPRRHVRGYQHNANLMHQRIEALRQMREQRVIQHLHAQQQEAQNQDAIAQRVEANVQGRLRLLQLERENLGLQERLEQRMEQRMAILQQQAEYARRGQRERGPR